MHRFACGEFDFYPTVTATCKQPSPKKTATITLTTCKVNKVGASRKLRLSERKDKFA